MMDLKLSCPAVSQICNLTLNLSSILMTLDANSTPVVVVRCTYGDGVLAEEGVLGVAGEEAAFAGAGHADQDDFELGVFGFGDSFSVGHLGGLLFFIKLLISYEQGKTAGQEGCF